MFGSAHSPPPRIGACTSCADTFIFPTRMIGADTGDRLRISLWAVRDFCAIF